MLKVIEKVLPDYIGGGKITVLMKEEVDIQEDGHTDKNDLFVNVKPLQKIIN